MFFFFRLFFFFFHFLLWYAINEKKKKKGEKRKLSIKDPIITGKQNGYTSFDMTVRYILVKDNCDNVTD